MSGRRSKLYSIFKFKCPHCHQGEFFQSRNPYDLAKAGDLLVACPVCHRRYTPEPGFYFGAMYVAYALAVALFVSIYVATWVLYPDTPLWVHSALIIGGLLVLGPYLYALSKTIWANLFFSYKGVDPTERERMQKEQRRGARGADDPR
jgi:uncharacterized protein (DUF983 family)